MQPSLQKLLQKRFYDVLSHTWGLILVIAGLLFCLGSVFMFGETVLEWSQDKYAAVFNSFSENIAGKSFQNRLCLPVPIDVVYTWVNGSDPELLMDLKRYKLDLEKEVNVSKTDKDKKNLKKSCTYSQCVKVLSVVLEPNLPEDITIRYLKKSSLTFKEAVDLYKVSLNELRSNFTVVTFSQKQQVEKAVNQSYIIIQGQNYTIHEAYITSDWTVQHSILSHDTIIMSGFPHTYSAEQLKEALPEKHRKAISKMDLYSDRGLAILHLPRRADFDSLVNLDNLTIDGKEPTLNAANLVWDFSESLEKDVASASRFEDNEELRYSIRSLERFAPWVRHIYIVTNGQIPSWLNMDHTGVTIVTHQEIFVNQSHLPTFGSPAIEAHIHRIPGLSDKFIYLNDDVMFGKEVWPDDFYTHSRGQKVYLSWPVPNCEDGCPSNWIRDGYCDKACNNSNCDWDGGDCDGSKTKADQPGGQGGFYFNNNNQENHKLYCSSGCANNWIADKYCDQSCNVLNCGFDAADCGTENFNQLHGIDFKPDVVHYSAPVGVHLLFFNLSGLLVEDVVITEASYNKSDVIRTAAVALKFKVLTVVLYENFNQTKLSFSLTGNHGEDTSTFQYNFTLMVDTRTELKANSTNTETGERIKTVEESAKNVTVKSNTTTPTEPVFIFHDILENERYPKKKFHSLQIVKDHVKSLNSSDITFPDLKLDWEEALKQFEDGDITEKGLIRLQSLLLKEINARELQTGNKTLGEALMLKDGRRSLLSVYQINENSIVQQGNVTNSVLTHNDNSIVQQGNITHSILTHNVFWPGGFKWERSGMFLNLLKEKEKLLRRKQYVSTIMKTGRSLNQFADSLRHVNKIYNQVFGYTARKVPSHMPHMIDKNIMARLQSRFPEDWDATSSHKVRSSTDMQFAFSYFYYLMGDKRNTTAEEVFDMMDTDKSKILSDREIRTLATRLYNLPLDLQTLTGLENMITNCSKHLPMELNQQVPEADRETYYVKEMPQVTRNLFVHCPDIEELLRKNFQPQPVYQFEVVSDDSEVAFKMIKTNVSSVVGQLDDIRKHPKKFICLNDNIDHTSEEAKTVKAILVDFYESMFPIPSQFELPRDYRNRFLRVEELREWKKYRDWLKFWTNIALALLVIFAIMSFFGDKIEACQRAFRRRFGKAKDKSKESECEGEISDIVTV